jgi:hypothetical protein
MLIPRMLLIGFLVSFGAMQEGGEYLDLTVVKNCRSTRKTGRGWGGGVGGSGVRELRYPLKMTLLGFDKKSYRPSEAVEYEVLIENIGQTAFVIPWASECDLDRVRPDDTFDPPGYRLAYINLVYTDPSGHEHFTPGGSAYGSELVPGSLKSLQPGQKVTIRILGHLKLPVTRIFPRLHPKGRELVELRAQFAFLHELKPYLPLLSENSMLIELER